MREGGALVGEAPESGGELRALRGSFGQKLDDDWVVDGAQERDGGQQAIERDLQAGVADGGEVALHQQPSELAEQSGAARGGGVRFEAADIEEGASQGGRVSEKRGLLGLGGGGGSGLEGMGSERIIKLGCGRSRSGRSRWR